MVRKSSLRLFILSLISLGSYMMYSKSGLFMMKPVFDKYAERSGPDFDHYVIKSSSLPKDPRFNPTIANGFLGHKLYGDTIYKNGLYNGAAGDSHRARIPGMLPYVDSAKVKLELSEMAKGDTGLPVAQTLETSYKMDMKNGVFSQQTDILDDSGEVLATVVQKFYAHKLVTRLLVTEVTLKLNTNDRLIVPLRKSSGLESEDIKFELTDVMLGANEKLQHDQKCLLGVQMLCGKTVTPEQPSSKVQEVCVISTNFPKTLSLDSAVGKSHVYTFLTSVDNTAEEAKKFYMIGLDSITRGMLYSIHCKEWNEQWDSGSVLLDSVSAFQGHSTTSGLYYLLSAFPPPKMGIYPYNFYGASPGGLTNGGKGQDYWGHIFWDQDFWMLPALLPLYPELVKYSLRYRIAKLKPAMDKASSYGYKGAMYPWESAYTGMDVCPGEKYVRYEQHVTGDMIHALRNYVYLTEDWDFFTEEIESFDSNKTKYTAWDMLYQTAMFWLSRATWNEKKGAYDINNVMGPDEYHSPVNNSVFTNAVAVQNIKFAMEAAEKLGKSVPLKEMEKVVQNMIILYDEKLDYHPEFDGFNPKRDWVKQADTIMLRYPLMWEMEPSTHKNDLVIYEKVTVSYGPAMTWGMFASNWLMLNEYDRASGLFGKQYDNIQPPFQIWSENRSGSGATNFLTGIGGYLQSILYGYLGLRIHSNHIALSARLPPVPMKDETASRLLVAGIKFKSTVLNVEVNDEHYVVELVKFPSALPSTVQVTFSNETVTLNSTRNKVSIPAAMQSRIALVHAPLKD